MNSDINYYPSKTNNDANYEWMYVQWKEKCVLKKSNSRVQEVGIENYWCKKY